MSTAIDLLKYLPGLGEWVLWLPSTVIVVQKQHWGCSRHGNGPMPTQGDHSCCFHPRQLEHTCESVWLKQSVYIFQDRKNISIVINMS